MKKSHTSRKTQSPLAITHVHDAAAGPSPAKGTIRHISTKHVSAGVPSMRAAPAAAGTEDESCASQPVQKLSQGLALIRLFSDTSTMSYMRSTSTAAGFGNVAEAAISSCVVHAYVMCPAGLPAEAPPAKPTSKPKAKKPHPPAYQHMTWVSRTLTARASTQMHYGVCWQHLKQQRVRPYNHAECRSADRVFADSSRSAVRGRMATSNISAASHQHDACLATLGCLHANSTRLLCMHAAGLSCRPHDPTTHKQWEEAARGQAEAMRIGNSRGGGGEGYHRP